MTECLLPILQYEDSSSEGEFEAAAEGSDDDDDDERMYGEEEEGEGDVGLDEEVLGSNTAADLATVYCLLCTGCCVLAAVYWLPGWAIGCRKWGRCGWVGTAGM